jgi:hypothetical protein
MLTMGPVWDLQQQEAIRQKAALQAKQQEQANAILKHVGPALGPFAVLPAGLEDRQVG